MAVRKFFPETIDPLERREGYHKMAFQKKADDEYVPRHNAEKRFVETVKNEINRASSGLPNYDTGYLFVDKDGGPYIVKHNLGFVPSRLSAFFSTDEEPDIDRSTIHEVLPVIISSVGFTLTYDSDKQCTITTGSSYVHGTSEIGYLRLMFWR